MSEPAIYRHLAELSHQPDDSRWRFDFTVTWNVAGTSAAPVSCSNVDIPFLPMAAPISIIRCFPTQPMTVRKH